MLVGEKLGHSIAVVKEALMSSFYRSWMEKEEEVLYSFFSK